MIIRRLAAAMLFAAAPFAAFAQEPATSESAMDEQAAVNAASKVQWAADFIAKLDAKTGIIKIDAAKATLNVPEAYYYLDAEDARAVLEEAWGNPPDETVLGMLLPAGMTPLDDGAWAATFSYQEDGYVSDKDAAKTDYAKVLKDMQKDAVESNKWRVENNYTPIEIVGWAEPPIYSADTHKIYWAKELKFGDAAVNTLNYDIRVLGRSGVLVIGFIADMTALPKIREAAPEVLDLASFDEGARYADFKKGDKIAAYGLAGLVAGGLIAKKTGLIAAILLFGKKFIAIIAVAAAGLFAAVRKFFAKKS
jgi:uncharacterized membrane-anchored protein